MPTYVIKVGKTLDLSHKKTLGIMENTFVQAKLFEEDRNKKILTLIYWRF